MKLPVLAALALAATLVAQSSPAPAQAEHRLVAAAVADYLHAFYDAAPERAKRSVDSDVTKEGFWSEDGAPYRHAPMTYDQLIELAGMDYIEAFYDCKPALIERSVHTGLAKYGYYRAPGAEKARAVGMTFDQLRALAGTAFKGREVPATAPRRVRVLDALDQTAVLEIEGAWGLDYAHAAKRDGKWQIHHVVWQSPPPLEVANAANTSCPFSGDPIQADSLNVYRGKVIGFCNADCRDKFAAEPAKFVEKLERKLR